MKTEKPNNILKETIRKICKETVKSVTTENLETLGYAFKY